jgi:hypothetical protein
VALAPFNAICFVCLTTRAFDMNKVESFTTPALTIYTGPCEVCSSPMVRLYPLGYDVPETLAGGTYATYHAADGGTEWNVQGYRRHVSVQELLNKITNSVDLPSVGQGANWGAILRAKCSASHFDAIVETIMTEGMRMPVVMWDATESGTWTIGNGHHRLVACMLLGMETIPVFVSITQDYMRGEESSDDINSPIERGIESDYIVWNVIGSRLPLNDIVATARLSKSQILMAAKLKRARAAELIAAAEEMEAMFA